MYNTKYIYIYIYMHNKIYIHIHIYIHAHDATLCLTNNTMLPSCSYIHIYIDTYMHLYVYIHIYIYAYIYTSVCIHICIHPDNLGVCQTTSMYVRLHRLVLLQCMRQPRKCHGTARQILSVPNHLHVCYGAQRCIRGVYEATSGIYMYASIHPYLYIHMYMYTYIYMCTPLQFVCHIRDPMVYVLVAQLCDTQPLHMSNNTFAHPQIYIHSCTIVCRDGGMRSTRAQHPPSDSHCSPHQKISSRAPGTDSCNLC